MKQSSFRWSASRWRWVTGVVCGVAVGLALAQSSSRTEKHHKRTASSQHRPESKGGGHKSSEHKGAEEVHGRTHASREEERRTSSRDRRGHHVSRRRVFMPKPTHESIRLSHAFVASATLRPMAQQLITSRSAAAYAGVADFAAGHPGEGAAAANLALGHAYLLDRRYGDAEMAFHRAALGDAVLGDYADYLGAQAAVQGNRAADAVPLLTHFAERHPGSLFDDQAPVLLSSAYLAQNDPASALRVLQAAGTGSESSHVDYRLALAKAYQAAGNTAKAADLYRNIYLGDPLSPEAGVAKTQMLAMNTPLTAADRKRHADSLFNAKQYGQAAEEYRALQKNDAELEPGRSRCAGDLHRCLRSAAEEAAARRGRRAARHGR